MQPKTPPTVLINLQHTGMILQYTGTILQHTVTILQHTVTILQHSVTILDILATSQWRHQEREAMYMSILTLQIWPSIKRHLNK